MPILTDEERIGTTLAGKYSLDSVIGRGGMGTVFAGHHALSSRAVAVKVLHAQHVRDPLAVRRFLNEARTAAAFRHANVVDVLDVDVLDDGTVFIVLELLEGETLGDRLARQHKLSLGEALAIVVPVLRALAHAHRLNIVHRDLKPDNIFLLPGTKQPFPVLLDFGIAKVLGAPEQSIETVTGTIIGTPQYMAPEQALGSSENTPQLDIYAMGVVLFECLAGERPIDGNNPATVLAKLVTGRVPSLRSVAPDVAESIAAIVTTALSPEAKDRFDSCDLFADALLREASALGVNVELPQIEERMAAGEATRTQRLRAATESGARRVLKKRSSDPHVPAVSNEELALTKASIAATVDQPPPRPSDSSELGAVQSAIPAPTGSRARASTAASFLGAALALLVVASAAFVTLRRDASETGAARPPVTAAPSNSTAERAPTVIERAQQPAVQAAAQPTTAPQNVGEHHALDQRPNAVRRATPANSTRTTTASATSNVGASTTSATSSTNTVAPTQPANVPDAATSRASATRSTGAARPPEMTNEW